MKHCPRCQQSYSDTQRFCLNDGVRLSLRDPYHLVGRTLVEKYRIDALIGVGGMGAVYSAHHLGLDRRVAFKILLPHLAFGNPEIIGMFEREAKTAGCLLHENIVSIFDAGRTNDDIAYIAMEWLDGRTLEDELTAQGPFSFERVAEILEQIAGALEEAHARRIIHRDLKPSNVMLIKRRDGRERIKVLDFGISKVLNATGGSPVSSVMGTPHYASPEQFQVGVNIDGRADIYSLGVMLYEILAGVVPFNATSATELIRLQMCAPPPPLRQLRPEVPVAVELLVNRLLAKEPDERPQHVSEIPALFAQALRHSDHVQVGTTRNEELLVVPDPPRAKKDEMPSTSPVVIPASQVEKVPPEDRIPCNVTNEAVSANHQIKETRQVQQAVTLPEFEPGVVPDSTPRLPATTRWALLLNHLDRKYIVGGSVLIVALSVALWLTFSRHQTTSLPPKASLSSQTPSPPAAPSPELSKPAVSEPSPTQTILTPESRRVRPQPSPTQDDVIEKMKERDRKRKEQSSPTPKEP